MLVIPWYIKLALGFLLAGFVFHLIGFTTPYWVAYSNVNFGLWTSCVDGYGCNSYSASSTVDAVRAFEVLAFIMFIAIVVLLFVYLSTLRTNLQLASIICTFILVGFIIIGVIIFATKYESHFHFSFAFCIIGAILAFIAGILLIVYRVSGVTVVTGGTTTTTRTTRTVTKTITVG